MPIYNFKCLMCNAANYTAPAVHFKGTGWGADK